MKTFKLVSLGFVTLLLLVFLTACGSASIIDEPNADGDGDTIDVNVDGGAKNSDNTLRFNPASDPSVSSGILVPTGAEPFAALALASVIGAVCTRRKRG